MSHTASTLPPQLRAIAARAIPNGTTVETHSPVHTIHCLDVHMQVIESAAQAIEQMQTDLASAELAAFGSQSTASHLAGIVVALRTAAERALQAWDSTALPQSHDGMMQERMEDLRCALEGRDPS